MDLGEHSYSLQEAENPTGKFSSGFCSFFWFFFSSSTSVAVIIFVSINFFAFPKVV